MGHPPELSDASVTSVRVIYPDLHGVARGKDVPLVEFDRVSDHGLAFCAAVMATDLRHTPVLGPEIGYPDLVAKPDLATLTLLPWEPGVASCIADVGPVAEGSVVPADPRGVVRQITESLAGMGMGTFAANHEFMNAQYEINLRHAPALVAADRAFRLKCAVKDVAALNGLVATFMGKPFNDQGGSGFHLHVSADRGDDNAFFDRSDGDGVSDELRRFTAGVLAHAPALMAFLNPTINAYRRIVPDSLAPINISWGWDNRTTFVRIPAERGRATRVEIRIGDGSANPYLAVAAILFAGLHGLTGELPLPDPVTGDAYTQAAEGAVPTSLEAALDALEADDHLRDAIGDAIVAPFMAMKRFELERHRSWVSDWERDEYLHHL